MPDQITTAGLEIKSLTELRAELVAAFQSIYGADINVDPDAPDGQIINIFAQNGIDIREVLQRINAGFDPEQAEGRILDARVGINGIARNGGSFTVQEVEITTDRALNLAGLDADSEALDGSGYTVRDDVGNEYILLDSQAIGAAGTYSLAFRAKDIGSVEVSPNTITSAVTIIAGVTAINNPAGPTVVGNDEESDSALRLRRRRSISITALGYTDAIEAAIADIDGVTTAIVKENATGSTDGEGTPGHTIWAIVEGGSAADIATAIYNKRPAGVGMRGVETYNVTRVDGSEFTVSFDRPENQNLWIDFDVVLVGGTVNETDLKDLIAANVLWRAGRDATADAVTSYVKGLNENYQITNMRVSDDGSTFVEVVAPTASNYRFINDTTRITINA